MRVFLLWKGDASPYLAILAMLGVVSKVVKEGIDDAIPDLYRATANATVMAKEALDDLWAICDARWLFGGL